MGDVEGLRTKYEQLRGVMDERVTRLWAASEAQALGRGGIAAVVEATGISKSRVRAGIADLEEQRRGGDTTRGQLGSRCRLRCEWPENAGSSSAA